MATESRVADRIGYVRQIVEKGQVKTPAGQTIDAPAELRAQAERHLSLIDELDDGEEAGPWAAEAYDTVKELVARTVDADPTCVFGSAAPSSTAACSGRRRCSRS